ncbi:hypothetical protein MMC27_002132 [Xylographa pallens]|nr:hypothetical protein [Xylographa pallens]
MTALALNPLSIRNTQPNAFHVRRKYSVRQRNNVHLALKSVEISPHIEGSTRLKNDASVDCDCTLNARRDIRLDAVSGSVRVNQWKRNTTDETHAESRSTYEPILQEKLVAARRAQAEWRENITHDAERRDAAHQQLLQLAKEERQVIANEEREALDIYHQRQIEAHFARLATVNLRRQLEAEDLRREAEEWRLGIERQKIEAQQRIRDEQDALALQQAILIAEDLQRQEEAEDAERQRTARQRECTVCLDTFDMGIMVELRCEHWYCRDDLQGMATRDRRDISDHHSLRCIAGSI